MAKQKTLCLMGLLFFVTSYVFFSQGSLSAQKHIDLHWFNLTEQYYCFLLICIS
jgi:hypothetical protein